MPVPAVDADKRGDAYKKVKPVDGIDEQGLVPDPQVMHVLFARLMAILGPLGILPADQVPCLAPVLRRHRHRHGSSPSLLRCAPATTPPSRSQVPCAPPLLLIRLPTTFFSVGAG